MQRSDNQHAKVASVGSRLVMRNSIVFSGVVIIRSLMSISSSTTCWMWYLCTNCDRLWLDSIYIDFIIFQCYLPVRLGTTSAPRPPVDRCTIECPGQRVNRRSCSTPGDDRSPHRAPNAQGWIAERYRNISPVDQLCRVIPQLIAMNTKEITRISMSCEEYPRHGIFWIMRRGLLLWVLDNHLDLDRLTGNELKMEPLGTI